LEEKAIMRIGGREIIPCDVRIIAATNKDLAREVALNNFRSDLYYRLNVICIEIPPLRERKDDIPIMIKYLMEKLSLSMGKKIIGIDPEFIEFCKNYSWPGNVRELQNVIEKAINCTDENIISLRNIAPPKIIENVNIPLDYLEGEKGLFKKIIVKAECEGIRSALIKNKGNKSLAAKKLGIARSTLYRKLVEIS
jgi:transcriptional regulator with PAS, ATPase and Fis domain